MECRDPLVTRSDVASTSSTALGAQCGAIQTVADGGLRYGLWTSVQDGAAINVIRRYRIPTLD